MIGRSEISGLRSGEGSRERSRKPRDERARKALTKIITHMYSKHLLTAWEGQTNHAKDKMS